jgi:hypothetical protein
MSAQDIINTLPDLSRLELEQVDARLHQLLWGSRAQPAKPWGEALMELAGTAEGLPEDFAHHHDHYLHGAPR